MSRPKKKIIMVIYLSEYFCSKTNMHSKRLFYLNWFFSDNVIG